MMNLKFKNNNIFLAYSDADGNVYDFPDIEPVFRTGRSYTRVNPNDLIELPQGSYLFSLPGRYPVFYNHRNNDFNHITVSHDGEDIFAVSAFLASGYLRTYLPAYIKDDKAPLLSLWAYTGLVIKDGKFFTPAMRIDNDPRSDYAIHQNDDELAVAMKKTVKKYPDNRLVKQLAKCSTEYRCLCARNFFLARHEAPIPTSPACNSDCLGCLSFQEKDSDLPASQERLKFKPSPEEISQVILHHFNGVDKAVASFGQGCEGEPMTRSTDLAKAISMVRDKTDRGTININTNGSVPDAVNELIDSGLDSIRISLNSPGEKYYTAYHRPQNYTFDDVKRSLDIAINRKIFVSINLFFMPGFTDMETEAESLFSFLKQFPVNMIQTRNLNIDPDYYFDTIDFKESPPLGITNLLDMIKEKFPDIRLGYYNPGV